MRRGAGSAGGTWTLIPLRSPRLNMYARMPPARRTLIFTRPILFPRTQPRSPLHRPHHTSSRTYDPPPNRLDHARCASLASARHIPSLYFPDRETVGAGSAAVPTLLGTNGIRFDAKYDSNAHAHSVTRHPSGMRMGCDNAGRERIRVDTRELVRDVKKRRHRGREYASSWQHHRAPGVDDYPNAALQGPNVSVVARAHRPSRSRENGAGVPGARRRSVRRSPAGSSWSIDEMLRETARDREGGRRRRWRPPLT
ncbi:hypothetical protein DFH11DRAFT_851220 [Phellopilus nigrolimitatus]|nr:hypothetical protein DFH11DRAFT_851220 [Phellopilus nigrolimitatus]